MSSNAASAANCKLACTEYCERVSSLRAVGDDILFHSAKIPCKETFKTVTLELELLFVDLLQKSFLQPSTLQYHNLKICELGQPQKDNSSASNAWFPADLFDSLKAIPHSSRLWNFPLTRSFACSLPVSKTPLIELHVSTLYTPSGPAPKPVCGVLSTSQLQHDYVCRFLGTSDECAQTTEFVLNTTDDSHTNQGHRRGEDISRETQKHT